MLEFRNVTKIFNAGTVLEVCLFEGFDMIVPDRQFVSVIGSNGSGKTTLLNLICGSITPDGGEILLDGKNINRMKEFRRYRRIGRVYQNPATGSCPNLTVTENMALADNKGASFGLGFGVSKKRIEFYREQLYSLGLGLEDKMEMKMGSLSGGQRQAAALVMATMTPIDFLILDEHTAALDPKAAEAVMRVTDKVVREKQLTSVMVTHNLRYAAEYGDRLIMMHSGRIVYDIEGQHKNDVSVDELLKRFNEISIECGN